MALVSLTGILYLCQSKPLAKVQRIPIQSKLQIVSTYGVCHMINQLKICSPNLKLVIGSNIVLMHKISEDQSETLKM